MLKRFIFIAVFMMSAGYAGAVNVNELNPEFFTRFNDDCLVYYINQAIENNHNAKQATYQVEQYRQQAKYSLGKELPSFSVSADYLGINTPKVDYFKLSKSAFVLPFQVNYEAEIKQEVIKRHLRQAGLKKKLFIYLYCVMLRRFIQTFLSTMRLSAIRKKSLKTINKYSITTIKNLQEA